MLAILITLDCVRADVLGEASGLTPNLDALAPEWTTFTQAFAQSQNTLSSHLSMLSSNYLFQHGVYSNFSPKQLPAHALTNRLAGREWDCRAFTSVDFLAQMLGNQIGPSDDRFPSAEDKGLKAAWNRRFGRRRAAASDTVARGLKWLTSSQHGRSAFLWMHLFDAHMAYEAPGSFRRAQGAAKMGAGKTAREQFREKGWFSPDFPEYDWRVPLDYFPRCYRAAVAYQDHCLGAFFASLKKACLWDDALIMVTADHGECLLGDHLVYCAHKKLFDTTVHVPLRVKFPGGRFAGEKVDALVQHVDLAPTVAALADFEEPLYMGKDLVAVASGKMSGHDAVFSEHVDNFLRAARDREHIYVERVPGSDNKWNLRMEEGTLFTRASEPADDAVAQDRLKAQMDGLLSSGDEARAAWGNASSADDEVAERLKSLGYM